MFIELDEDGSGQAGCRIIQTTRQPLGLALGQVTLDEFQNAFTIDAAWTQMGSRLAFSRSFFKDCK